MSKKPFDAEQLDELRRLAAKTDEEIDTNDIPEIPADKLALARRGDLYRPIKRPVTIRLDADVVEWFKSTSSGKGYQTEINSVLRRHVLEAERKKAS
jgi:uncharacterized protein (DUF4415 family)